MDDLDYFAKIFGVMSDPEGLSLIQSLSESPKTETELASALAAADEESLDSLREEAAFLSPLADKRNLRILFALLEEDRPVEDLAATLGMEADALGEHLRELDEAGLIALDPVPFQPVALARRAKIEALFDTVRRLAEEARLEKSMGWTGEVDEDGNPIEGGEGRETLEEETGG